MKKYLSIFLVLMLPIMAAFGLTGVGTDNSGVAFLLYNRILYPLFTWSAANNPDFAAGVNMVATNGVASARYNFYNTNLPAGVIATNSPSPLVVNVGVGTNTTGFSGGGLGKYGNTNLLVGLVVTNGDTVWIGTNATGYETVVDYNAGWGAFNTNILGTFVINGGPATFYGVTLSNVYVVGTQPNTYAAFNSGTNLVSTLDGGLLTNINAANLTGAIPSSLIGNYITNIYNTNLTVGVVSPVSNKQVGIGTNTTAIASTPSAINTNLTVGVIGANIGNSISVGTNTTAFALTASLGNGAYTDTNNFVRTQQTNAFATVSSLGTGAYGDTNNYVLTQQTNAFATLSGSQTFSSNNIFTSASNTLSGIIIQTNATLPVPPKGAYSVSLAAINTNQITLSLGELTAGNVLYTWSSVTNGYTNFASPFILMWVTNGAGTGMGLGAVSNQFWTSSKNVGTNQTTYLGPLSGAGGPWQRFSYPATGTNGTGLGPMSAYVYTNGPSLITYASSDGTNATQVTSVGVSSSTISGVYISTNVGAAAGMVGFPRSTTPAFGTWDGSHFSGIFVNGDSGVEFLSFKSAGMNSSPLYVSGNQLNIPITGGFYAWNGNAPAAQGTSTAISGVFLQNTAGSWSLTTNLCAQGTITATNGFASYASNVLAPSSITFPATTVPWTNTIGKNIFVLIDGTGVTGTALKINGTQVYSLIVADMPPIPLQVGEYFSMTYTVGTPSATIKPF